MQTDQDIFQDFKTSFSHPLQIAEIRAGENMGKIGITFCPGKIQHDALSGRWKRDLKVDIKALAQWNAAAVLTLLEPHEIEALQVTDLGEEVRQRQMIWRHAPIQDVSVPSAGFETKWQTLGPELRELLSNGFNVLVHCKGGLGRAGMIAARLLVESGWEKQAAILAVRSVRRGAIETREQEDHVRQFKPDRDAAPDITRLARRDRAIGSLLGLAVGDALGTTLEFTARDSYEYLTEMVGGGPFNLDPGKWTDDSSMALALADSLDEWSDLDQADLMGRFYDWFTCGRYSSTGHCFDIGETTRAALMRWKENNNPIAGSNDPDTAGNGSLMRLSPAAIRFWHDQEKLQDIAVRQSETTHAAPAALEACRVFANILGLAISGAGKNEALSASPATTDQSIELIIQGSWRGKPREQIRASGYVVHSLEAAIWSVARTGNFEEAVLLAANLGEDADTTAAIAGQLAGALYGVSGIPARWCNLIHDHDDIVRKAERLFDAAWNERKHSRYGEQI